MRARIDLLILTSLGTAFIMTPNARAQQGLAFVPYTGVYLPTASMVVESNGAPSVTHQSSLVLGGRVTYWSSRVGGEATIAYSPSAVDPAATYQCCNGAHVITQSLRALVRLSPSYSNAMYYIGGGVGWVAHGGRAYQDVAGATSIAETVGAGAEIKLGASPLTFRVEAEDYHFSPRLTPLASCEADNGGTYTGICGELTRTAGYRYQSQNDIILSFGLAIRGR